MKGSSFFGLLFVTSRAQADAILLVNRIGSWFSVELIVVLALIFAPVFVGLMSFRRKARNKVIKTL
jgi:hypothetical protein